MPRPDAARWGAAAIFFVPQDSPGPRRRARGKIPRVPHRQLDLHEPSSLPTFEVRPGAFWPPTWPMGLTMLRLLLLPVFLYLLLLDAGPDGGGRVNPHRWWAMSVFAVMALTDKLDGYLARRLHQTTRLGTLLDPIADKLLVASSLILLGSPWIAAPGFKIPLYVVIAVYGKDVAVAAGSIFLLYTVGTVAIKARPLGKLGTFLQLLLVILVIIAPDLQRSAPQLARSALDLLEIMVAVVAGASLVDYVIQGIRGYLEAHRRQTAAKPAEPFPPESLN